MELYGILRASTLLFPFPNLNCKEVTSAFYVKQKMVVPMLDYT